MDYSPWGHKESAATNIFTFRIWKQPRCPSTEERMKKMRHIYTMEYYSAIKRNTTGWLVEMWMDPESVIQGEVIQKEKNIMY